jgi:protein Mpv17
MAWAQYRHLLNTHPLKTKALTSSFITGLSDVCLQLYEKSSKDGFSPSAQEHHSVSLCPARSASSSVKLVRPVDLSVDWSRSMTLAAVGLCYSGPIGHAWFATLERLVRIRHQVGSVAVKLCCDQSMVPVIISGYFVTRGTFEGKSMTEIYSQLQSRLATATLAAWQFWPAVNLISFSVVPVMYRVLFGNISALFWNAKLSSISSQKSNDDAAQPSVAISVDFHMQSNFEEMRKLLHTRLHTLYSGTLSLAHRHYLRQGFPDWYLFC